MLPKLRLAAPIASCPGVTPVPLTDALNICGTELARVLKRDKREDVPWVVAIEIVPACAPLCAGVNVTVKFVLCPAASVRGSAAPLIVKLEGLMEACVMVRDVPPELIKAPEIVCCVPMATLPKLKEAGWMVSAPEVGAGVGVGEDVEVGVTAVP